VKIPNRLAVLAALCVLSVSACTPASPPHLGASTPTVASATAPPRTPVARAVGEVAPIKDEFLLYNPLNPWGKQRELPAVPRQTFRQWYLENRRNS